MLHEHGWVMLLPFKHCINENCPKIGFIFFMHNILFFFYDQTWFTRLPLMNLFWIWTIERDFSSPNTELSRWCLKNTDSVWVSWREEHTDLLSKTQQTRRAVTQPSSSNRRIFMSALTHAYFNCKLRERKESLIWLFFSMFSLNCE